MSHLGTGRALAVNAYEMLRKRGAAIPTTLLARLDALGVDIAALEARHSN